MIAIGSDHGGFHLKKSIVAYLEEQGLPFKDFGTHGTESVDYPEYGKVVALAVATGACEKGILICGTGIGISIAANKVSGIRAALCTNGYMARMSREHNDANILALGERVTGVGAALDIVKIWLHTDFLGGRHQQRVHQIEKIEKKMGQE